MKKRFILLILLLIWAMIGLSGCGDSNEPERVIYAYGVALDYQKGRYVAYIQFIDLASMVNMSGGGPSGSPGGNVPDIEKGTGRTINEAMYHLYAGVDRRVYWGHLSFVILSDTVLGHQGLRWGVDLFNRYYEVRYSILYYVTKSNNLEKELASVPVENIPASLNKLSDPDSNYSQNSYVTSKTMREVILELDEPNHQVEVPFISLMKKGGSKKEQASIKYEGVAILTRNGLQGKLTRGDVNGLRWFNKGIKRIQVILKKRGSYFASVDVFHAKAKIFPAVESDGSVHFKINVKAAARVNTIITPTYEETLQKMIEKRVRKEIERTYRAAISQHIDPYHFSEILYRNDNSKWRRLQDHGSIPLDESSLKKITVQVTIKNSGKNNFKPTLD